MFAKTFMIRPLLRWFPSVVLGLAKTMKDLGIPVSLDIKLKGRAIMKGTAFDCPPVVAVARSFILWQALLEAMRRLDNPSHLKYISCHLL